MNIFLHVLGRQVHEIAQFLGTLGDKDPPPTHHSREGPGKAPGEHRPERRGKETEGGGHAKGAARRDTPETDPSQGGRGTTPIPHSRNGGGTTTHSPHTHTKPPNRAQKGEDRHPNARSTHRTHARACKQHTSPQPPPTRAPQTHTTHQSASTARTKNARNTRKPKEQGPSNPPPGELQGCQKHR